MALTATQALSGARRAGKPLPRIADLADLYAMIGDDLREGQLIMVAGRPGSQKSGWVLWLVSQWNLPTLYMSADMSQHTISTRLAAITTGMTSRQISETMSSEDPEDKYDAGWISQKLGDLNIGICCTPEPSLEDIDAEISAWVELRDEFPKIIVVDNLMDMAPLSDQEYQSDKNTLKELQVLARETGATIVVTHHMKEDGDASMPLPAKGVQGKVTQSVEVALSVALDSTSDGHGGTLPFRISPVKVREGKGFPNANQWIELAADPARTMFKRVDKYMQKVVQQA